MDKGGAVHHSYRQSVTEPVAYPPAFDGTLTAEKALAWVRQNYRVLPGGAGLGEEGLTLSQNGQDITAQGFATDRAGSCLIAYRVVDEYGNTATLYLTDTLTDGSASGDVTPLPDGGNGGGQGSGEGTGPYTGEGAPISSYARSLSASWARGELTGEQMKQALLAHHRRIAEQERQSRV